jgi:uncharacterized protein (TIGR02679 family)
MQSLERRSEVTARLYSLLALDEQQIDVVLARGWRRKLDVLTTPGFLETAARVLAVLPIEGDTPRDRRLLSCELVGSAHALDPHRDLSAFILDVAELRGLVPGRISRRDAWRALGVLMDGVHDGTLVAGIAPVGFCVPAGMAITLPARTLGEVGWPRGDGVIFVSENPSIFEAALAVPGARIICTMGTPSDDTLTALRALDDAGWRLLVRGDFDHKGLALVTSVLDACAHAQPWRMTSDDYHVALSRSGLRVPLRSVDGDDVLTPWDTTLRSAMTTSGVGADEELLIDVLLADIERGWVA